MAKSKADPRVIDVGPNLTDHSLIRYQIFLGGVPAFINAKLTVLPALRNLFVPINKLAEAETAIKTAGTPLNKYFVIVKEAN